MDTKAGTHLWLCAVVAAEQDLVVQYFVFVKAVLHAGMSRQRLLKVALSAMNLPLKFQQRTFSSSTTVHITAIHSFYRVICFIFMINRLTFVC